MVDGGGGDRVRRGSSKTVNKRINRLKGDRQSAAYLRASFTCLIITLALSFPPPLFYRLHLLLFI